MTIHFDNGSRAISSTTRASRERTVSVVSVNDLGDVCVHIQYKIAFYQHLSYAVRIRIKISTHVEEVSAVLNDGQPVPGYQLIKCLEPLRQIRGANFVEIDGPGHHSYLAEIKATMLENRPSAAELMELAGNQIDQGENAFGEGNLEVAVAEYKVALRTMRSINLERHWDQDLQEIVVRGRYRGFWAGLARDDASVRLHTLIADYYLQSENLRLARVYVERVYGPLFSKNNHRRQKFPLRLPAHSNTVIYAELLLVAARISLACRNEGQAREELQEAAKLDPSNIDIWRLLEQRNTRHRERSRRRLATQEHQHNCARQRLSGMLFTIRCLTRAMDLH